MSQVAHIFELSGSAFVLRDGKEVAITKDMPLYETDILNTHDGSLKIVFTDGSNVSIGPETELLIEDYVYSNTDESFILDLVEGTMQSISGDIVKRNPDAFKIETPKATIGIRGTTTYHFVGKDGTEEHAILSISPGHTVVVTLPSGESVVLTTNNEGLNIPEDSADYDLIYLTPEELSEIEETLSLNLEDPSVVLEELRAILSEISKQISDENQTIAQNGNIEKVQEALDSLVENPSDDQISFDIDDDALDVDDDDILSFDYDDDDDDDFDDDSLLSPDEAETGTIVPPESTFNLIDLSKVGPVYFSVENGLTAHLGEVTAVGVFDLQFAPSTNPPTRSLAIPAGEEVQLTAEGFNFEYNNFEYEFSFGGTMPTALTSSTNEYNVLVGVTDYAYGGVAGVDQVTANGNNFDTNFAYIKGTGGTATLSVGDDSLSANADGSFNIGAARNISGFTTIDGSGGLSDSVTGLSSATVNGSSFIANGITFTGFENATVVNLIVNSNNISVTASASSYSENNINYTYTNISSNGTSNALTNSGNTILNADGSLTAHSKNFKGFDEIDAGAGTNDRLEGLTNLDLTGIANPTTSLTIDSVDYKNFENFVGNGTGTLSFDASSADNYDIANSIYSGFATVDAGTGAGITDTLKVNNNVNYDGNTITVDGNSSVYKNFESIDLNSNTLTTSTDITVNATTSTATAGTINFTNVDSINANGDNDKLITKDYDLTNTNLLGFEEVTGSGHLIVTGSLSYDSAESGYKDGTTLFKNFTTFETKDLNATITLDATTNDTVTAGSSTYTGFAIIDAGASVGDTLDFNNKDFSMSGSDYLIDGVLYKDFENKQNLGNNLGRAVTNSVTLNGNNITIDGTASTVVASDALNAVIANNTSATVDTNITLDDKTPQQFTTTANGHTLTFKDFDTVTGTSANTLTLKTTENDDYLIGNAYDGTTYTGFGTVDAGGHIGGDSLGFGTSVTQTNFYTNGTSFSYADSSGTAFGTNYTNFEQVTLSLNTGSTLHTNQNVTANGSGAEIGNIDFILDSNDTVKGTSGNTLTLLDSSDTFNISTGKLNGTTAYSGFTTIDAGEAVAGGDIDTLEATGTVKYISADSIESNGITYKNFETVVGNGSNDILDLNGKAANKVGNDYVIDGVTYQDFESVSNAAIPPTIIDTIRLDEAGTSSGTNPNPGTSRFDWSEPGFIITGGLPTELLAEDGITVIGTIRAITDLTEPTKVIGFTVELTAGSDHTSDFHNIILNLELTDTTNGNVFTNQEVTITILDDIPIINAPQPITLQEGGSILGAITGSSGADGGTFELTDGSLTGSVGDIDTYTYNWGTVALNKITGNYTVTANASFANTKQEFTVSITDGDGDSDFSKVEVNITPVTTITTDNAFLTGGKVNGTTITNGTISRGGGGHAEATIADEDITLENVVTFKTSTSNNTFSNFDMVYGTAAHTITLSEGNDGYYGGRITQFDGHQVVGVVGGYSGFGTVDAGGGTDTLSGITGGTTAHGLTENYVENDFVYFAREIVRSDVATSSGTTGPVLALLGAESNGQFSSTLYKNFETVQGSGRLVLMLDENTTSEIREDFKIDITGSKTFTLDGITFEGFTTVHGDYHGMGSYIDITGNVTLENNSYFSNDITFEDGVLIKGTSGNTVTLDGDYGNSEGFGILYHQTAAPNQIGSAGNTNYYEGFTNYDGAGAGTATSLLRLGSGYNDSSYNVTVSLDLTSNRTINTVGNYSSTGTKLNDITYRNFDMVSGENVNIHEASVSDVNLQISDGLNLNIVRDGTEGSSFSDYNPYTNVSIGDTEYVYIQNYESLGANNINLSTSSGNLAVFLEANANGFVYKTYDGGGLIAEQIVFNGFETVNATNGDYTLTLTDTNDTYEVGKAFGTTIYNGMDVIDGGVGNDTLIFTPGTTYTKNGNDYIVNGVTYKGFENIQGGSETYSLADGSTVTFNGATVAITGGNTETVSQNTAFVDTSDTSTAFIDADLYSSINATGNTNEFTATTNTGGIVVSGQGFTRVTATGTTPTLSLSDSSNDTYTVGSAFNGISYSGFTTIDGGSDGWNDTDVLKTDSTLNTTVTYTVSANTSSTTIDGITYSDFEQITGEGTNDSVNLTSGYAYSINLDASSGQVQISTDPAGTLYSVYKGFETIDVSNFIINGSQSRLLKNLDGNVNYKADGSIEASGVKYIGFNRVLAKADGADDFLIFENNENYNISIVSSSSPSPTTSGTYGIIVGNTVFEGFTTAGGNAAAYEYTSGHATLSEGKLNGYTVVPTIGLPADVKHTGSADTNNAYIDENITVTSSETITETSNLAFQNFNIFGSSGFDSIYASGANANNLVLTIGEAETNISHIVGTNTFGSLNDRTTFHNFKIISGGSSAAVPDNDILSLADTNIGFTGSGDITFNNITYKSFETITSTQGDDLNLDITGLSNGSYSLKIDNTLIEEINIGSSWGTTGTLIDGATHTYNNRTGIDITFTII